jgi:hypothetical protein
MRGGIIAGALGMDALTFVVLIITYAGVGYLLPSSLLKINSNFNVFFKSKWLIRMIGLNK